MKRHNVTITIESDIEEHKEPFIMYLNMERLLKVAAFRTIFVATIRGLEKNISKSIMDYICNDLLLRELKRVSEGGQNVRHKENSQDV